MVWWASDASDDIQTDLCQKKSKKHKDELKGDWGEATESEKTQQRIREIKH